MKLLKHDFLLWESMLTAPRHLLVLLVPGNGFQDELFHYFPRDRGEVNWPVVPWVLLLEDRRDIFLPPVIKHLTQSPKIDTGLSCTTSSILFTPCPLTSWTEDETTWALMSLSIDPRTLYSI